MTKAYLGDGVYVDHDGYMLELTTENGYGVTNTVYLEPEVYVKLVAYVAGLVAKPRLPACSENGIMGVPDEDP